MVSVVTELCVDVGPLTKSRPFLGFVAGVNTMEEASLTWTTCDGASVFSHFNGLDLSTTPDTRTIRSV